MNKPEDNFAVEAIDIQNSPSDYTPNLEPQDEASSAVLYAESTTPDSSPDSNNAPDDYDNNAGSTSMPADASFNEHQYATANARPHIENLFDAGVDPDYLEAPAPEDEGLLVGSGEFTSIAPAADDADIPWRGIPPLPTTEPLVAGVLKGAEELTPSELEALEEASSALAGDPTAPILDPYSHAPIGETELVLGVKLRQYGPVYFFKAGHEKIKAGGKVLVETEQGLSLAEVISARHLKLPLPKVRTAEGEEFEIKPILGLAEAGDIAAASDNKILAASSRMFCKECIREYKLDMKLVDVEVLHDRSKIIFYFTAPSRIDFRELVKELVRSYRTRIELRQIGVRHETQMVGALGNCGMTCCCRRYLRKFAPVTIKMAKEQNLFLNPAKLSGICGRLLCCLAYEQENYELFHKRSPKLGKRYNTDKGPVKVLRANLFRQSIIALNEVNEEEEFQLDDWEAINPVRIEQAPNQPGSGAETHEDGRNQRDTRQRSNQHKADSRAPHEAKAHKDTRHHPREHDAGSTTHNAQQNAESLNNPNEGQAKDGQERRERPQKTYTKRPQQHQNPHQHFGQAQSDEEHADLAKLEALDNDGSIFGLPGAKAGNKKRPHTQNHGQHQNQTQGATDERNGQHKSRGAYKGNRNHKSKNNSQPQLRNNNE